MRRVCVTPPAPPPRAALRRTAGTGRTRPPPSRPRRGRGHGGEPAAASPGAGAPAGGDELVGEPRRDRVDGVVEEVDGDLFAAPEYEGRSDVEGGEGDRRAAPHRRAVGGGRLRRPGPRGAEDAAHDAPAGAVAPMREVVEASLREVGVERLDPERLGGRAGGRGRGLAVAQPRLDRAGDRHRRGPEEAGDEAVADGVRGLGQGLHAVTSTASGTRAPRRSIRWSPTRSALAMAVSAGFTAVEDGKQLVSTT